MNAHLFGLYWFLLIYTVTSPLSSVNAKTAGICLRGPLSAGDTQTAYLIVVNIAADPDGCGSWPVFRAFDALQAALNFDFK